jgi:AcrR family transcriptional regulator
MTQQNPDTAKKPRRPKLSAERIADVALALIDEVGLDNFSFRTLAERLGCRAMSIYHYYPSKAHLYEALVDICLDEIHSLPPNYPWRDRLRGVALSIRDVALTHPGFFLYFSIFRMNNRRGMTLLNDVLQILEDIGFDAATRARQFRSLSYYIMGAGLDESMGYARGPSAVEPVPQQEAARDFPAVAAAGAYFSEEYRRATFEYGLNALLDRIEAEARRLPAT